MHLEVFALGSSWLHKLDPRVKVCSAIFFVAIFATLKAIPLALCAFGIGVLLVASGGFSFKELCRRMAALNIFVVFLFVMLAFSHYGPEKDVIIAAGPFKLSLESLRFAFLVSIKSNAIILVSIALLCSMRVVDTIRALGALKVPDKLVQVLFFSLRYFQVIHEEYSRLVDAMRVRAFKPRTNWHTYKSYAYLVSMLLARSLDRAERVYGAMRCRGFSGKFHTMRVFSLKTKDVAFLLFSIITCALLLAYSYAIL